MLSQSAWGFASGKKTRHFYWKVNDFKMIQNYAYYSEREEFIVNDYFVLLFSIGHTHLFLEAVSIATHRQLSPSHPVFRLLPPYLRHVILVNW